MNSEKWREMEEKREEKREEKKDESVEAQVKEPLLKRFYITMTTKYQMVLTTFKWVSTILCLLTILFSYGVGMVSLFFFFCKDSSSFKFHIKNKKK